MGRQRGDQSQLVYLFNLEERILANHLLCRINSIVTRVLADAIDEVAEILFELRAMALH